MNGWQKVELGELVTYKKGFAFKSATYSSDGDVLIVRVSDTTSDSVDIKSCMKIPSILTTGLDEYKLQTNDVIIATVGSWADNPNSVVGKVIKVPSGANGALLNQNAVRLRCNEQVFQDYFYYNLKDYEFSGYLLGNAQGSANQASITLKDIFAYKLNLPCLPEQKAIASVLSSLDDKIDLLHRQNTTLERMAETLFRQWFVEEAQESWEEIKLGDFVEINKKCLNKSYPFSQIEYLDTGSLTEGKIDSLQLYMINKAPSRALRLVEHNDVLISTVRPNQKHYGIINDPIDNLVVSSGFCVLTCSKIDPHFVYLLLTNNEMTEFLHSIAEGSTSTYPSLKPSDIAAITFQLPPDEILADFAKIANDSWDKIHKNYKQIQTLEKLRDNLLPKLMSGEVTI